MQSMLLLALQIHLLLEMGAEINQRDDQGFTPLHRAAYLAHFEGYLEIYEYLLVGYQILFICCLAQECLVSRQDMKNNLSKDLM